jgi:Ca2+-binding RTX toxin-like protein
MSGQKIMTLLNLEQFALVNDFNRFNSQTQKQGEIQMAFITGTPGDDRLVGTAENDSIDARQGNDTVSAAAGNDFIFGNFGVDSLDGEAGNDTIFGEGDNDFLFGGDGIDYLNGGPGNDGLRGGFGDDDLIGGVGNDNLEGGAGRDDFFINSLSEGFDTIVDFFASEGDKLILTASGFGSSSTSDFSFNSATREVSFRGTPFVALRGFSPPDFVPSRDIIFGTGA